MIWVLKLCYYCWKNNDKKMAKEIIFILGNLRNEPRIFQELIEFELTVSEYT